VYLLRVLGESAGEVRDVLRAGTPTHRRLRDRLVAIGLATAGFDIVCAVLAFRFEHHQKQTQIESLGSALFWTNPISFPGRVLDTQPGRPEGEERALATPSADIVAGPRDRSVRVT
jgi:hypothetical protein